MPTLRFSRGLWAGVGGATPEHAFDALNVFEFGASILGRDGAVPFEVLGPLGNGVSGANAVNPTAGFSASTAAEPTVVGAGPVVTVAGDKVLWVGAASPWNYLQVVMQDLKPLVGDADALNFPPFLTVEYWNGSAWVLERGPARLWTPGIATRTGNDYSYTNFPLSLVDDDTVSPYSETSNIFTNAPPSDWNIKTIAAQALYWRRISGWPAAWTAGTTVSKMWAHTEERRIIHVNPFRTRLGGPHLFMVQVDENGKTIRFILDGQELTKTDALSEDQSGKQFDANTDVWSAYIPASDQVVGRVLGWGWFTFRCGQGSIQPIDILAPSLTGHPYVVLDQGLRSAVEPGAVAALFDGRLWAIDGNHLTWSAPDVYPDVWPNEFERYIQDGDGVVTCAVPAKTWMAVFCQSACYRVVSDGTSDGYLAEKILGGVGAIGPRCAVAVGDQVFFFATDGLYQMTADGSVNKVSSAINVLLRDTSIANRSRATLVYHGGFNQLRLFLCSDEESTIYDYALYGSAAPVQYQDAGGQNTDVGWWPQGRKYPTDYGFNACCVVMDNRETRPRMLIGDRYGVVWEHDCGGSDCGPPVYRKVMSAPLNLDTSQETVVRWVNVAQVNNGDVSLLVKAVADIDEEKTDSQQNETYVVSDVRVVDDTTLVDSTSTFKGEEQSVMMECSFETRCRVVQIGFEQEQELGFEFSSMEVRANSQGRLGAR